MADHVRIAMNWIQLIKDVGPFLGIMFFFIWRDYRREEALVKQVNNLNEFIRKELVELIEKTVRALNNER
jgi:hypothetical protein